MNEILEVKVKTNSKTRSLNKLDDGTWSASVMALPTEGKANDELLRLIARHYNTKPRNVIIKRGRKNPIKLIQVTYENN
ncbi:MAG: hypothetical protein CMG33_06100 [Candidatus Marinimicrobia bacterium]|nr:hypothetical protein [Candidatus Neomarinimicrobiota bacterium]NRB44945.1 DUF167 domain-containing protein [Verrucomicrobiales bacterium]|tara:strand:+ start:308 stop:544 length:237 start_codon:yes stop_codon:yes gene_type:complete